jgi:hypothetical protein
MAGANGDSSTPRPISPISPTGALELLLSSGQYCAIHDAAKDLTEWTHRNKCRLWCNGNLLRPDYITDSLRIVARTEADDRPRAEVVSSVREAWEGGRTAYTFELDADEVKRQLLLLIQPKSSSPPAQPSLPASEPAPSPPEASATRETERQQLLRLPEKPQFEGRTKWRPKDVLDWFKETIKNHPQEPGESKNKWAQRLYHDHMKKDFGEDIPWSCWESLRRRINDPSASDD